MFEFQKLRMKEMLSNYVFIIIRQKGVHISKYGLLIYHYYVIRFLEGAKNVGSKDIISNKSPFIEWHVRFATVPLILAKLFLIKNA